MLDRKTIAIAAIPKKTCRKHVFLSKIDIHAAFLWKDEQKSHLKIDLWVVLRKMNIKIHKVLLLPSLFCLKIHWKLNLKDAQHSKRTTLDKQHLDILPPTRPNATSFGHTSKFHTSTSLNYGGRTENPKSSNYILRCWGPMFGVQILSRSLQDDLDV